MAKMGKPKPKTARVEPPPFPKRLTYLWNDFCEVVAGMDQGFGPPIVTWQGLKAWSEMMGKSLEPWECRMLIRLGNLRADILAEQAKDGAKDED